MKTDEIRKKFINFFKKSPRNHAAIEPSLLVLPDDPTTLFTSSGMQQLVPYLSGKKHPKGKRLVNSQPLLRTQDIDKVGDNRHTTFFEMLGNWSLGDYFKEEQLAWCWEFLTKELELPKERLWVSIFEGDKQVPRDDESFEIWKKLGMSEKRIFEYGVDENWWSMTGAPAEMSQGDIGGPSSEVFYEFTQVKHDAKFGKECHPNCECGRFLEIGNSVFIQYTKKENGLLEELPQKNVDFGGGLERLTAATNRDPDIFNIDLFQPLLQAIVGMLSISEPDKIYKVEDLPRYPVLHEYSELESLKKKNVESVRKIMDHARTAVMIANDGVQPGNKKQGAVLRRLISGIVIEGDNLGLGVGWLKKLVGPVIQSYKETLVSLSDEQRRIETLFIDEEERFRKKIEEGKKQLNKIKKDYPTLSVEQARTISVRNLRQYSQKPELIIVNLRNYGSLPTVAAGTVTADMQTTYGLPITTSGNMLRGWSDNIEYSNLPKIHNKILDLHRKKSRSASAGMFKGGLADHSEEVIKLHTATHLLHWALREVLGKSVHQEGSNITKERLRFDFSHKQKLTEEEIEKLEELINEKVKEDLPVHKSIENKEEALKSGVLAFFKETYPEKVSIYTIGKDPKKNWISKEVCGGPHVKATSEIGRVRIKKQEKIGIGVVRIYAVIENG